MMNDIRHNEKEPRMDADYNEGLLIRTVFAKPGLYPDLAGLLKPGDFEIPEAGLAWAGLVSRWRPDSTEDELYPLVYTDLPNPTARQWFSETSSMFPAAASAARALAERIALAANKRRLARGLHNLALQAQAGGTNTEELLRDMEDLHRQVSIDQSGGEEQVDMPSALERLAATQQRNRERGGVGWPTGFSLLQEDGISYQPGHLWVVGAWTSTGKTAWMIESVCRFLGTNPGRRGAIFSTEMTEEQNLCRILANRSGIGARVILSGNMLPNHAEMVSHHCDWLSNQELYLFTKTNKMADIATQCRRLNMKDGGLDMVWLDFIQNVYRPGHKSNYEMMSAIARDLQALALELECNIVCLSQLPNHAGREDTGILEFKGAGEIAAACDIGVLMQRSKENKEILSYEVRKNRHGPCGKYLMKFVDGFTRIEEVSKQGF